MLIAGLTLGFGILAVFFAIIYRITTTNDRPQLASNAEVSAASGGTSVLDGDRGGAEPSPMAAGAGEAMVIVEATIPTDARLVASTVAGGRIVLTYDHFGGTIVMVVNPETLQIVGRLELKSE